MDGREGRHPLSTYFAYGANMSRAVMSTRCPRARAIGPGRLDGWMLCFRRPSSRWGGHAADLRREAAAGSWGVVWEAGSDEWVSLDRYEAAYRCIPVIVTTDSGPRTALTYVVADPDVEGGEPTDAYRAAMLDGAREHGLPKAWRRSLEAIDVVAT